MNEINSTRFSKKVYDTLVLVGWFPGRRVENDVERWVNEIKQYEEFKIFPAAIEVLLEFGGLSFRYQGAGEECAVEPFIIDPRMGIGEEDLYAICYDILGEDLFPLGLAIGWFPLAISRSGKIYSLSDYIIFLGDSFDEALELLIRGLYGDVIYCFYSG